MAEYKIIKIGDQYDTPQKLYYAQTLTDFPTEGVAQFDECYCISTDQKYIADSNLDWKIPGYGNE
jgi:hypothetical protein